MTKTKVLVVAHGHPDFAKGGAENAAYRLYQGINAQPDAEAWFLARSANAGLLHTGTPLASVRDREFHFYANADHFDFASLDPQNLWRDFAELLERLQPDVVHFHHYLHLGIEAVRVARTTLPRARIVMTLHEYLAICYNMGQMVKTDGALCFESSPAACHACRSERSPQDYQMRRMFLRAHMDLVDGFVAPSHFLRSRYIAAGIAPERITMMWDAGPEGPRARPRPTEAGAIRGRFVFMGQFTPFKGVETLLQAFAMLPKQLQAQCRLEVHGTGAHHHPREFQDRLAAAFRSAHENVRNCGPYAPAQQASILGAADWVVVPSTWWENAPLVIQEAFHHGRPVICSNIGGMAEKVRDGVDGMHFQVGSPASLADAMQAAATTPGLWDRLAAGIPATVTKDAAARAHLELYASFGRSPVSPTP
jgi:glycosyltransferase involved in cell wall biosynthesis